MSPGLHFSNQGLSAHSLGSVVNAWLRLNTQGAKLKFADWRCLDIRVTDGKAAKCRSPGNSVIGEIVGLMLWGLRNCNYRCLLKLVYYRL